MSFVLLGLSFVYGEWSVVESFEECIRKKIIFVNGIFFFNFMIISYLRFLCVVVV